MWGEECQQGLDRAASVAAKAKDNGVNWLIVILGGVGLVVLLIVGMTALIWSQSEPERKKPERLVLLTATTSHDVTRFTVKNDDAFDWSHCDLRLNSDYLLTGVQIQAGSQYSVAALQFATRDGKRFNPLAVKPQRMSISCETPQGKGITMVEWR